MAIPQGSNQRRLADFVHDVLADGWRFRIFAAVEDFARECLALIIDTSISGARVVNELGKIAERRWRPRMIVSDNGSVLTSSAVLAWSDEVASNGTISPWASRCRMPLSGASTDASATSA